MAGFLEPSYGGLLGGGMVKGNVNSGTGASNQVTMLVEGFIPFAVGAFLNKSDVACVVHPTDEGDDTTNIAQWFVVASAEDPIQLTIFEAYGGSALGSQVAGFQRTSLTGNIGVGSDSFSLFAYESGIDDMDDMLGVGYFDEGADILRVGDVICVATAQGANPRGADLLKVTANDGAVVTVVASDFSVI